MLLVVTDHARRRQFVLNALLRRSTDARLERLAHEQLVEKRKDRELLMAMTFHEVRNPLNGTMGHLQLARHVLQTTAVDGGSGSGGAGGEGDGGGGEGGLVAAALAEVDASLVCTEMALHFLGALSSLHRSVTAGMSAQPTLCDLSAVGAARRDAHAAPRHPGCNPTPSSLQPYTIQPAILYHPACNPIPSRCSRASRPSCGRSCSPASRCASSCRQAPCPWCLTRRCSRRS